MKKFLVGITVLLFGVVAVLNLAFAALSPLGTTWSSDDTREVNNATPGTQKAFLGTYAQGPIGTVGATTYASGENSNASLNSCSAGSGVFSTPTTTVFLKTTGALTGESYCLGNAVIPGSIESGNPIPAYNQRLTIVLTTDGGKDFYITPRTKTGFTSVQLNDANDSVTLKYINATVGWIIEGNNGVTVN